jgi:hypothetical protein
VSKSQVEYDYQKLLWERQAKILADCPKTFLRRLDRALFGRTARYYPMPVMPIDDDYRSTPTTPIIEEQHGG